MRTAVIPPCRPLHVDDSEPWRLPQNMLRLACMQVLPVLPLGLEAALTVARQLLGVAGVSLLGAGAACDVGGSSMRVSRASKDLECRHELPNLINTCTCTCKDRPMADTHKLLTVVLLCLHWHMMQLRTLAPLAWVGPTLSAGLSVV